MFGRFNRSGVVAALLAGACLAAPAAAVMVPFNGAGGLAAEVEFTQVNATTLRLRIRNLSTGVPAGFGSADQLLTGVSFDFGAPGSNGGEPTITGGTAVIGPSSQSVNFSTGSYGPGTDIGGEWGFGNGGGTGILTNFSSGNQAGLTLFGGPNLDGPGNPNGPQAGLVSASANVPDLGGLGAIRDEIIVTLSLSAPLADLGFISTNLVTVEFGSDAGFITNPTPGAATALVAGALVVGGRRRRR